MGNRKFFLKESDWGELTDAISLAHDKIERLDLLFQHVCDGFFERTAPELLAYALPDARAIALASQDLLHDIASTFPEIVGMTDRIAQQNCADEP